MRIKPKIFMRAMVAGAFLASSAKAEMQSVTVTGINTDPLYGQDGHTSLTGWREPFTITFTCDPSSFNLIPSNDGGSDYLSPSGFATVTVGLGTDQRQYTENSLQINIYSDYGVNSHTHFVDGISFFSSSGAGLGAISSVFLSDDLSLFNDTSLNQLNELNGLNISKFNYSTSGSVYLNEGNLFGSPLDSIASTVPEPPSNVLLGLFAGCFGIGRFLCRNIKNANHSRKKIEFN